MVDGLLGLPRAIPPRIALELALTGEMMSAERLDRFGLINGLTDPGGALAEAHVLATQIAANAPMSIDVSKRVIQQQIDWPLSKMFDRQAEITGHILTAEDAREEARAFAEKRAPKWTGR